MGQKKIRQEIEQNSREVIEQKKSNRKYWLENGRGNRTRNQTKKLAKNRTKNQARNQAKSQT